MVLHLKRTSAFPIHDDFMVLLAWFVDKVLPYTMLQYDAFLSFLG